ncbi:MAG: hypothetical protein ACT4OJ_15915 [Bacteroidota bacterium]
MRKYKIKKPPRPVLHGVANCMRKIVTDGNYLLTPLKGAVEKNWCKDVPPLLSCHYSNINSGLSKN